MNKHWMVILCILGVFILYTMQIKEGLDRDARADIKDDVKSWAGEDDDDEEFRGRQEGFLSGSKVNTFQESYDTKEGDDEDYEIATTELEEQKLRLREMERSAKGKKRALIAEKQKEINSINQKIDELEGESDDFRN